MRMRLVRQFGTGNRPQMNAIRMTGKNGDGFHGKSLARIEYGIGTSIRRLRNERKSVSDERSGHHDRTRLIQTNDDRIRTDQYLFKDSFEFLRGAPMKNEHGVARSCGRAAASSCPSSNAEHTVLWTSMNSSPWIPLTQPLSLAADTVHVVRISLEADAERTASLRALLSADELKRADRYKVEHARRHFIVCRATLRTLLGSCLTRSPMSIQFTYGPQGKPSLQAHSGSAPPLEFSVSHSANQALIAVSLHRPLGVDLEQIDESVQILKLASRFFSPKESAELNQLPPHDQLAGFFRGWTCKEAYLKATGRGLSFPLNKFSVRLNPREPARLCEVVDEPAELSRWQMLSLDAIPGFAAAVLYAAGAQDGITVNRWTASARTSLED